MIKRLFLMLAVVLSAMSITAKTLIVYYSYTNHIQTVVADLLQQIEADAIRIEPAEKGLDYAANNYAIGSAEIAAIRNNPNDASSYPAIDPVTVNMADYDMVIVATPLWWSNMAAPMQSFLFQYGGEMAGKHIGLIVSSASSGISEVVSDAKRLIPNGNFVEPNLWIRSSQTSNCHSMITTWLNDIDYSNLTSNISTINSNNDAKVTIDNNGIGVKGNFDMLSIFSLNGNKLFTTTLAATQCHLLPGCYIAQLKSGNNVQTTKLLIR